VIPVTETPGGVSFRVRVLPRAGKTGVAGIRGDALLIRLAAAPVDGAANEALVSMLATLLERPQRDVSIAAGERSRDKLVRVSGLDAARVSTRLLAILPP
jgi:uncharacterized protein (TIGR00251 family)